MKQTVLIGLGGTGSRVVNNVAKLLQKNSIAINNGIVTCAVMDTNQADNELIGASGTDIPVIPTCDERIIDEYLANYAHKNPREWCPWSPAFGAESMIDGASEIRVKSRIAFMDTMESGKIIDLQNAIEKVFHNRPGTPEKIRVMLVSSLSGGTGAGMFIQVALWLRKFFEERSCIATIRGIFLLPDVFIRTLPNVRNNARKKLYHYANAYAAIRELNAINKVIKGNITLERPLVIDGLFDSRKPQARPVFDNAFFIDDVDSNGAAFTSIETYEEMVAQIVYMQLYAPMHSEISSVEDNLFRAFESNPEPVYGSSGTSKAEYPTDAVVEYCALRASKDSIAEGWNRIDSEIDTMIEREKEEEKDGVTITNKISRRDEYIKLFDEKSSKTGKIGKSDRLFVSIKKDVFNEKHEPAGEDGKMVETLTCKVEAFVKLLNEEIERTVTAKGRYTEISDISGTDLPDPEKTQSFSDNLVTKLKGIREAEIETIESILKDFDDNCKSYANTVIRSFVPDSMGSVTKEDQSSLYGLFIKKDVNGEYHYVHPVAAKYLLYKLSKMIELLQKKVAGVESSREAALEGDPTISFDNKKTLKKEELDKYWQQVGLIVSKGEIQHFLRVYKRFNERNADLCMQYETELLTQMVLNELSKRVKDLIDEMEKLFKNLSKLTDKYNEEIADNVKLNEENFVKTMFVYAKEKHKNEMYDSLDIDLTGRNDELNRDVIDSVYGKFCFTYRPNAEENKIYEDKSVVLNLHDKLVESFRKLINKEHKEDICLDIIDAIKKESDFAYNEKNKDKEESDPFDRETKSEKADKRHNDAIISYRNQLQQKAAPFLITRPDAALAVVNDIEGMTVDENNAMWMTTEDGSMLRMDFQTTLTFWGFNPKTASKCPGLSASLGANKTTAASDGYGENELYCYSSIYGIVAEAINKFNEESMGDYYKHYSAVINTMIKNHSEVDTPHLDKTWHEFLPYVSSKRQNVAQQKFYRTFWLGFAYDRIRLDEFGHYEIGEQSVDSYGNKTLDYQTLLESERTITRKEVGRLLKALRAYPAFEGTFANQMNELFENDVADMDDYAHTDLHQGLVIEDDIKNLLTKSNPLSLIVRYASAQGYNAGVKNDMLSGLGEVMRDLASHLDVNRGDDKIDNSRVELCHRIYEKSRMKKKNSVAETWINDFKRLKKTVEKEEAETDGNENPNE